MKKFTVYEIEKLTNGKLSKYKLNQAIEKGDLKAEFVEGSKKGRGTPKFFVREDDLDNYLKQLTAQKQNKITVIDENFQKNIHNKIKETVQQIIEEKQDQFFENNHQLKHLLDRISFLETQNNHIKTVSDNEEKHNNPEKEHSFKRRELLMELANISIFSVRKKKEILSKLNKIS